MYNNFTFPKWSEIGEKIHDLTTKCYLDAS
jgi:hypothetical protein